MININNVIKIVMLLFIMTFTVFGFCIKDGVICANTIPSSFEMNSISTNKSNTKYQTTAIVYLKEESSGETIKTEFITGLKVGDSFTYVPINNLFYYFGEAYLYDDTYPNNKLTISILSKNPDENIINVYYKVNRIPGGYTRVTINFKDTDTDKTIKSESLVSKMGTFQYQLKHFYITNDNVKYIYDSSNVKNSDSLLSILLQSNPDENIITIYYKATESVGEETGVIVNYVGKAYGSDKTEFISGLKIGDSFIYKPLDSYIADDNKLYIYDRSDKSNLLTIQKLSANWELNVITVCYKLQRFVGEKTAVTIKYKEADSGKVLETQFIPNVNIGQPYVHKPATIFTDNKNKKYEFSGANKKNILIIRSLCSDWQKNCIIIYYNTDLSKSIINIPKVVYNGKTKKPNVIVKCNGKELIRNKDYRITYKNSRRVGKAKATIKGIGNYVGNKTVSFNIFPKVTKIKKVTTLNNYRRMIYFRKSVGAKGYESFLSRNRKFTKGKKVMTTKNFVVIKRPKKGKVYYVRVRAYAKIDGKLVYSSYSTVKKIKINK